QPGVATPPEPDPVDQTEERMSAVRRYARRDVHGAEGIDEIRRRDRRAEEDGVPRPGKRRAGDDEAEHVAAQPMSEAPAGERIVGDEVAGVDTVLRRVLERQLEQAVEVEPERPRPRRQCTQL